VLHYGRHFHLLPLHLPHGHELELGGTKVTSPNNHSHVTKWVNNHFLYLQVHIENGLVTGMQLVFVLTNKNK